MDITDTDCAKAQDERLDDIRLHSWWGIRFALDLILGLKLDSIRSWIVEQTIEYREQTID